MKKWKVLSGKTGFESNRQIIDELLKTRGITAEVDRENFFSPKMEDLTIKKSGISKAELVKAVRRIKKSISGNEKIIIYGDYDVDGICATAILWETIYSRYKNVYPYIPDRFSEGYGLSDKGIRGLLDKYRDAKLIITVDNGIVANKAVKFAKKQGIDVIITDHHVASENLPAVDAIVHTTKVCGAGVSWMLSRELGFVDGDEINNKLELAALATVADLVPLVGLSRIMVIFGLKILQKTKRPGLIALFKEAGIIKREIDVYKIGHMISPRLNASGRITHAIDSLRLICTNDSIKAGVLAKVLNETNTNRQLLTKEMSTHAVSLFENKALSNILIASSEFYEQGVIGLIASRLAESYSRPSIAISIGEKTSKGSARSVKGVNIVEFIRLHGKYLVDLGGHPMAAGFTIETGRIENFKVAIEKSARQKIQKKDLNNVIEVDLELPTKFITQDFLDQIERLSPFGIGNKSPIFLSKGLIVRKVKLLGKNGEHIKIEVSENGKMFDAIGFNMGKESKLSEGDSIDLVYSLEENNWDGKKSIQFKIKDLEVEKS